LSSTRLSEVSDALGRHVPGREAMSCGSQSALSSRRLWQRSSRFSSRAGLTIRRPLHWRHSKRFLLLRRSHLHQSLRPAPQRLRKRNHQLSQRLRYRAAKRPVPRLTTLRSNRISMRRSPRILLCRSSMSARSLKMAK